MTPRQVFDVAVREYWLGLYPTPEERLAAARCISTPGTVTLPSDLT